MRQDARSFGEGRDRKYPNDYLKSIPLPYPTYDYGTDIIMKSDHPRIKREKKTVEAMIGIYCKGHHEKSHGLCTACDELLNYGVSRLDKCPFGEDKPTCASCTVHCYIPVMRGKIKAVMRYSGPRMVYTHPVLAVHHLVDKRKKTPQKEDKN